jgi:hypothetical protein
MTASLRAGVCSYFPIREVGIYLGALPDREKGHADHVGEIVFRGVLSRRPRIKGALPPRGGSNVRGNPCARFLRERAVKEVVQ